MLRLAPVLAALVLCSGAAATTDASGWCRAPTPASWKHTLSHSVVALSRRAAVLPIVGAGDGRSFFAQLYSPAFSGVVRIDARTSRVTRIRRFPNAHDDQAVGAFDGRWLVWQELHTFNFPPDDFTIWAYDTLTRTTRQIGAAGRDPGGNFWPSPGWRGPDVRDGYAAWAQGSGPGGIADVNVYDLAASNDRVVRHGHAQNPFLISSRRVLWPESIAPGKWTRFLAVDAGSGRSVRVPKALAGLRGISALFTDGRAFAYPSARFTSLWWSPSLRSAPQLVFKPKNALNYVDNGVRIAGRYLIFTDTGKGYLADTKARRYVELGVSPVAIDRRALIVSSWTKGKTLHPRNRISFIPVRSLPRLPRCA